MFSCYAVWFFLALIVASPQQWDPTTEPPTSMELLPDLESLPDPIDPTKVAPGARFGAYSSYITGSTPAFPAQQHVGEGPDNLCLEQAGSLLAPSPVELEATRRMEALTHRYSRHRSHKPLVKHQLKNKASFLRQLLGRIGQDPTDEDFETGQLDTTRSIPLRFIKALNNVVGETSTVVGYLWAFGYLPKVMKIDPDETEEEDEELGALSVQSATPCQIQQAIEEFQAFNGLDPTRELDDATFLKMKKSRCGVRDVGIDQKKKKNKKKKKDKGRSRNKRYVLRKRSWNIKKSLTYFVKNCTTNLEHSVCKDQIKLGLQRWTEYAPIIFKEVDNAEKANFVLYFVTGVHPKKNLEAGGNDNPFDGPGGVLAHAYFPKGGHVHFDDTEEFTANSDDGFNLQFVAMHEIGHALGLEHSNMADSVMAPVYDPGKGWLAAVRLRDDDIAAIREKYGAGTGRVDTLPS